MRTYFFRRPAATVRDLKRARTAVQYIISYSGESYLSSGTRGRLRVSERLCLLTRYVVITTVLFFSPGNKRYKTISSDRIIMLSEPKTEAVTFARTFSRTSLGYYIIGYAVDVRRWFPSRTHVKRWSSIRFWKLNELKTKQCVNNYTVRYTFVRHKLKVFMFDNTKHYVL